MRRNAIKCQGRGISDSPRLRTCRTPDVWRTQTEEGRIFTALGKARMGQGGEMAES